VDLKYPSYPIKTAGVGCCWVHH